MKADTGASRTFLKEADIAKLVNVQQLIDGIIATLPKLVAIQATYKGTLPLQDALSKQAKEA